MDQLNENELNTPDSADALSPTFERSQTLKETKRRLFLSKLKTISIYRDMGMHDTEEARDGFAKRVHSNSADFSKKVPHEKKTRSSEFGKQKTKEPKIIITLARDETENKKTTEQHPTEMKPPSDEIQSPLLDISPGKSHIPGIFRKRSTHVNDFITTTAQIRHRQSLTRSASLKPSKNESGRLLNIIANQALFGKQTDVSKTFLDALKKTNEKALERARNDYVKKKRHSLDWHFRQVKLFFKRVFRPLKPDSGFIIAWKLLILCMIVVQCVLSTYILSFLPDEELDYSTPMVLMDLIFDIIYLFDILLNFRTAFYHRGELCLDSSKIATNYLHSFFLFDVISLVSIFGRTTVDHSYKAFILFDLLRIVHIPRITAKMQDYFQFSRQISSIFHLFKLCCAIIVFAHWWACCLFSIAKDDPAPNSWILEAGLDPSNISEVYVASMYWSIATMATIGYGDIHPVTYRERILSIVIMIASSIIFGYILSSIGSVMSEIGAFNSESREKMRLLTKYMSDKGLNKDIQGKIRKYLEFYLDKENTMKMEGDNILQLLSFNLKEEIIKEVNAKILGDTYMFSSNFRKKFLYLISKDLVEKPLAPDEMIFTHNDFSDASIYFVTSGAVEIIYEKCTVSVQRLEKGESFGFLAFFADRPRTASVKSVEFSTVFQLKREKFLERLEDFPSEKETYCMIKDSINLYENYQYLNLSCYSCGSKNHITLHCKRFHFTSNKSQIIGRYLLDERRFNRDFKRPKRRRFHAYANIEIIQEAALQIQVIQQNELHYQSMITEKVEIYSEGEDILDKNIYHPQPMTYTAEPIHTKMIDVPIKILTTLPSIHLTKEMSKKRLLTDSGDVQAFVHVNYDPYYHNLNIDKVKSFEVYYPNNNITKLLVGFETVRLENIVQMRLGVNAKHISPLLVKSFKMNERIKVREKASAGASAEGSVLSNGTMSPTGRRHINKNISMINPSDITFYSSIKKNSIDFGVHQSGDQLGEKRPNTLAFVGSVGGRDGGPNPKIGHSLLEQDEWGRYVRRNVASARDNDEIPQERYIRPQQQRVYSPPKRSSDVRLSLFSQENMRLGHSSYPSNSQSSSDSDSESDTFNVFTAKADPSGGSKKKTSRDRQSKDKSSPEKSRNLLETSRVPQSLMLSDLSIENPGGPGSKGSSDLGKLRISQFKFNSGANVAASENEDVNSPVDSPFDFTNQMKKLSRKLEENRSLSPYKKPPMPTIKSPPKQARGSLARMMIKERNMQLRKDSKGRSASEDQERKAEKVIEEFGLMNIVKREFLK